jgi:hypothetical protein
LHRPELAPVSCLFLVSSLVLETVIESTQILLAFDAISSSGFCTNAQTHKHKLLTAQQLSHVKNKKYNNATPRARLISCLIIKPILIEKSRPLYHHFIDGSWSFGRLFLVDLFVVASSSSCFWTSAIKYSCTDSSQEQSPFFTIQLTDQTSCRTLA